MHEIITLQLGQRSNYVATHFWNSQESYFTYSDHEESLVDHDIHFRAGIGADGIETFTPRTVIYDLKGGFGTLRKINALYDLQQEGETPQGLWNGPTVVQRQTAIERNLYQQSLEEGLAPPALTTESVRYWSDFNRVVFHPKSIVQLDEYELGSSLMPFETWSVGEDLFGSLDKEHDVLDRDLRPFAEEADQMQAIQLITSSDDAWGGFASRYMDRLRDEYGKTTVWVWGAEDGVNNIPREKQLLKISNTARTFAEISSLASLFIPMSLTSDPLPSYVNINRQSLWHVSALLSTALESITLPSRLKSQHGIRTLLDEMAGALNVNGNQKIAKMQMSVRTSTQTQVQINGHDRPSRLEVRGPNRDPRVPSRNGLVDEPDVTDDVLSNLDIDLFPSNEPNQSRVRRLNGRAHTFGMADAFRGEGSSFGDQGVEGEGSVDGHERARRRAAGQTVVHRTRTPLSFSLLDSFPHIFTNSPLSPKSVSVQTILSTETSVALRLKNLQSVVSRTIGLDEREALSNSLGEIAEIYQEGWDSGSDEDDD